MKLGRIGAVMAGLVMVLCCLASSAEAKVVVDRATGQKFGILPVPRAGVLATRSPSALSSVAASGTPTCDRSFEPDCATPMSNHGGPVQHAERDYLFFWDPGSTIPASYVSGLKAWLNGLAAGDYTTGNTGGLTGNPISVTQQYYDTSGPGGAKSFIPYAVQNAGTITDTDPFPSDGCTDTDPGFYGTVSIPHCLTRAQLQTELTSYIAANNLPTGINVEYFILTPPGMGSCFDSSSTSCAQSGYCGWHTTTDTGPSQVVFADIPWLAGTSCEFSQSGANSNLHTDETDAVIGVMSHELAETMTDPDLNAWYGTGLSDEIGDKCAYQFSVGQNYFSFTGLPFQGGVTNAFYNTTLGGHNYLMQLEYDNQAGGCNLWNIDTQPTASISGPSVVTPGSTATFSLSGVSAPSGVAYVNWTFGDGTTTTATSAGSVQHTFVNAGSRTVTAILTDNHGNEVKKTKLVTVGSPAALSIVVTPKFPAPKAAYALKLSGRALPGGTLGSNHNRSALNVYEQFSGTCATTWAVEVSRAKAGKATRIETTLLAAGPFALTQHRTATPSRHTTVRFCGYVARSATLTDAQATAFYTST